MKISDQIKVDWEEKYIGKENTKYTKKPIYRLNAVKQGYRRAKIAKLTLRTEVNKSSKDRKFINIWNSQWFYLYNLNI